MQQPGLTPAEQREHRRAREAKAQTALIYGGGQIVLGLAVCVLAYESAQVTPLGEQQGKALLGILIAFAVYALYRGTRQWRDGWREKRALEREAAARERHADGAA